MAQIDFTTALARLLSNRELRAEFRADPVTTAAEMNVCESERAQLIALDSSELELQARGLIAKRRHEVSKLLPQTFESLGADVAEIFDTYAHTFWPEGHDRHGRDALEFARVLQRSGVTVNAREMQRLRSAARAGNLIKRVVSIKRLFISA